MFWSKNKKNMYTPAYPSFAIYQWGIWGYILHIYVFMMGRLHFLMVFKGRTSVLIPPVSDDTTFCYLLWQSQSENHVLGLNDIVCTNERWVRSSSSSACGQTNISI